jgi:excisionase family DNA binding protein
MPETPVLAREAFPSAPSSRVTQSPAGRAFEGRRQEVRFADNTAQPVILPISFPWRRKGKQVTGLHARLGQLVFRKDSHEEGGGRRPMAKAKPKESLLKSKDAAHILDCSPDDVIDLARKGKLRAVKQGRFWRFRQSDVVSYKKRVGVDGLPKIGIGRGRPRKGDH